ncbi:hypothetical protein [Streptomyces sp. NPDC057280]|uniref:hypothetical protein n=1 Tax=Streptomyces sp. NPDC057280 TaxID=3346081 RepID=UPI00362DC105
MSTLELTWGTTKLLIETVLDALGFFVLALPGFYAGMLLTFYGVGLTERVLRKRGLLPVPRSRSWFLLVPFLALCTTYAAIVFEATDFSSTFADIAVGSILGAVLGSTSILLVCVLLRPRRRTGPRAALNTIGNRSLNALAVAMIPLAPAAGVLMALEASRSHGVERWSGFLYAALSPFAVMAMGGLISLAADRLKPGPAQRAVTARTLYLRPFESEHQPFGELSGQDAASLETILADAMTAKWEPFVALGNPTERIAPSGAVRVYLSDTGWKDVVTRMISEAHCVLAVPSQAPSTLWEFTHIRQTGQQRKLFVLTPLAPTSAREAEQYPEGRWLTLVLHWFLAPLVSVRVRARGPGGQPPFQSWETTAKALAAAGYLPGEDPGPGSLVSFDQEGRALAVANGCSTVRDYLHAADRHLALREETSSD